MSGTVDRWTTTLRRAWRAGTLWPWCLAAIAAACGYAVATVFHPGYLSADSNTQLWQALGDEPMNDWHPPVMALLWRIIIRITGDFSTMAALQAAVLGGRSGSSPGWGGRRPAAVGCPSRCWPSASRRTS